MSPILSSQRQATDLTGIALANPSPPKLKNNWWNLVLGVLALVFLLAITPSVFRIFVYFHWVSIENLDAAGKFGDAFGFLNSVLTSVSVLILAYTLYLQRQQLEQQRKDISAQSTLLRDQIEQERTNRKATIIFKLIGESNTLIGNLRAAHFGVIESGLGAMWVHSRTLEEVAGTAIPSGDNASLAKQLAATYWPIIKNVCLVAKLADGVSELEDVAIISAPKYAHTVMRSLMNCNIVCSEKERILEEFKKLPAGYWDKLSKEYGS